MNASARPILRGDEQIFCIEVSAKVARLQRVRTFATHTSASFAMNGFPTAMTIAWAVEMVPENWCLRTVEVLE